MEEVAVDPTSPLLDLSYRGIAQFQLQNSSKFVRALVLSGNPIADFSFIKFLPELRVLHGDSMGVRSFDQILFGNGPQLTHLVWRNNALKEFQFGDGSDSLQVLDVSQNPFKIDCEEEVNESFSALKTLTFGCLGEPTEFPAPSCSGSNLNSLSLFKKFFLERFYTEETTSWAVKLSQSIGAVRVGSLQFELHLMSASCYFQVKKLAPNESIRNEKLIITLYEITTGFQINQTYQEILPLSRMVGKERFSFVTKRNLEVLHYPTEAQREQDSYIFSRLRQQMQRQHDQFTNYYAVTVEYQLQVGVFFFSQAGSPEFLDFNEEKARLSRSIKGRNGITMTVVRNPRARFMPAPENGLSSFAPRSAEQMHTNSMFNSGLLRSGPVSGEELAVRNVEEQGGRVSGGGLFSQPSATSYESASRAMRQVPLSASQLQPGSLGASGGHPFQPDGVSMMTRVFSQPGPALMQEFGAERVVESTYPAQSRLNEEVRLSNPLPQLFQDVKVVGGDVQMIHYYTTKLTGRQIVQELHQATQGRYSDLRINELFRKSILAMNQARLQMIQRENKSLIYVKVQSDPPIALKLVVEHQASISNRSFFTVPEEALNKFLVTVVQDSQAANYVYMCENAVRFIPRVSRVEIGGGEGVLRVAVFETYRGRVVPS